MSDVTIKALSTDPAPADYDVPPAQEIVIKLASAIFDGSGAAGAFVPTLEIVAPDRSVVGSFPVSDSLAAGASAFVSWFPRGGLAAKATPAVKIVEWGITLSWGATAGFYSFPSNNDGAAVGFTVLQPATHPDMVVTLAATYTAVAGGALSVRVIQLDTVAHRAGIVNAKIQEIGTTNRQISLHPVLSAIAPSALVQLPWGNQQVPNALANTAVTPATWNAGGVYAVEAQLELAL